MKKLFMDIQIGTLMHTVNCLEGGQVYELVRIPIDNIPETLAYYAHDKNITDIVLYGNKAFLSNIKNKILDKSQKEYGASELNIEIKEKD